MHHPDMDPRRYAELYCAPLSDVRRESGRTIPTLDARHFDPPAGDRMGAALSLRELYVAGALCGHAEARAELGRRAEAADRALADLGAISGEKDARTQPLAIDLIEARHEVASLRAGMRALE